MLLANAGKGWALLQLLCATGPDPSRCPTPFGFSLYGLVAVTDLGDDQVPRLLEPEGALQGHHGEAVAGEALTCRSLGEVEQAVALKMMTLMQQAG